MPKLAGWIQASAKGVDVLRRIAADSGLILFTAPKGPLGGQVKAHADRAGMPHVTGRWIGGTLTNLVTIRQQVERLHEIEVWEEDGTLRRYSKIERARILREKSRLLELYDGLRRLERKPAALIVVRPSPKSQAIAEARTVGGVVIIAVTARGAVVPGSDIAIQTRDLYLPIVVGMLADAVKAGKAQAEEPPEQSGPARVRPIRPHEGPGTAPVPARLRPKPSPKSGRARPETA